jgi:ArsR family transcriptional regulator, virulence genes transcriptional regulator
MPATGTDAAVRKHRLLAAAGVQDHATEAAALFKALANEQRLLVLCALLEGPRSVGEINARVPLSQSALSQHLAVLRAASLVTTRRASQTIYYAFAPGPALRIMEVIYAAYCAPDALHSGSARATAKRSRANRGPAASAAGSIGDGG